MDVLERYLRNRCGLQIVTNYLVSSTMFFFALQNLSTNWGGDHSSDNQLSRTVQSDSTAGVAWDERVLQVGALQLALSLYVFGAEMQGNLTIGRYKRFMAWGVNVPVFIFAIGNVVLAQVRVDDDIQREVFWDAMFAATYIVIFLLAMAYFAFSETYSSQPWFQVTYGEVGEDPYAPPAGTPGYFKNRFWLQTLLHVAALGCLLYFTIVGLHYHNKDKGWQLTDTYKADALAVSAWDAAGGMVGMYALTLVFCLTGFELLGDFTPSQYKAANVFATLVNIFVSSIFMYATHWDAWQRDVTNSHIAPLIIMIVLCLWAIALIVCYACVGKYGPAIWVKVLADPIIIYKIDVEQTAWQPQPAPQPEPAPTPVQPLSVSPAVVSNPVAMVDEDEIKPLPAVAKADRNYVPEPVVEEEDLSDIVLSWAPPPGTKASEIEYKLTITDLDPNNAFTETHILPGSRTQHMIDEFSGEPIIPDEEFDVTLAWRYKSEGGRADGGWNGTCPAKTVRTAKMTNAAALLRSRVPRIHLREQMGFKANHDDITKGSEALPEIAALMSKHPDMTLGVDGHVNFGQKPPAALRLSRARADRVCNSLRQLGVDADRLVPAGYGYERPRYPQGTKFAGRNRRVEFRVLPGSGLYERLAREAAARLRAVNGIAEVESFIVPASQD